MIKNDNQKPEPVVRDEEILEETTNGQDREVNEDNLTEGTTVHENELNDLQNKYDELNNSFLRLHDEFDNFRKRTLKEKAELIRSGGERVLLDIITLVDDFERALAILHDVEDKDAMLEGMDLIYSKFISFLTQHGIKEIVTIGQPFDAERFEAVTTIPVTDASEKGLIVDCIQKGYEMNEKIIRFPKVIVGE
jgi:molecular chaperone GrpE